MLHRYIFLQLHGVVESSSLFPYFLGHPNISFFHLLVNSFCVTEGGGGGDDNPLPSFILVSGII